MSIEAREPQIPFQEKVKLSTWKEIVKIVWRTSKKNLICLIISVILVGALDTFIVWAQAEVVGNYAGNGFTNTFIWFISLFALAGASFGFLVWMFIKQAGIIEANTSYELRKLSFEKLQVLSFSFFDQTPQGWVMARMTSDSRRLSNIISWGIVDFVWAFFNMLFILIMLFIYEWRLAIVVLVFVPLMFGIAYFFRKKILQIYRKARKYNSELTSRYNESFMGAQTTKSLVIEEQNLQEFSKTAEDLRVTSIRAVKYTAFFSSLILIISYIAVGLVLYFGADLTIKDAITIQTLVLFTTSVTSFFNPIMSITSILAEFQQAQASAERILYLIKLEPAVLDSSEVISQYGDTLNPKKENWEELSGDVTFENVSFNYVDDEIVLNNFNIQIKAGQTVALVGHTGSGKTTIVNLLSRFYEPVSGRVLIDGKDYKERSISWLHDRLGYVLQSPHLFSTTVMENIRYGKLDATDEEVINAAKIVGADEFIMNLKEGYQSKVGSGGGLLSVGQQQLISFARAIVANPRILILDEATSSIDSESELVIQHAVGKILANRTSFVVAHRLSTIVNSDVIIMLELGEIIEMGSHQELLQKRGAYFNLYRNQFLSEKEDSLIESI